VNDQGLRRPDIDEGSLLSFALSSSRPIEKAFDLGERRVSLIPIGRSSIRVDGV
jgi:hypothetical protein